MPCFLDASSAPFSVLLPHLPDSLTWDECLSPPPFCLQTQANVTAFLLSSSHLSVRSVRGVLYSKVPFKELEVQLGSWPALNRPPG